MDMEDRNKRAGNKKTKKEGSQKKVIIIKGRKYSNTGINGDSQER